MKTLMLCLFCLAGSILANPITKNESDLYVTEVNNTAVCVVNKVVHHDGALLPSADPCEICRCRPPGFACAYVRCIPKEPRPECHIKEIAGQCCPQYVCESNEIPAAPSAVASAKPETRSEDKLTEAPPSEEAAATVAIEGRDDLPSTAAAIEQRSEDELKTTEAPRSERLDDATKKPELEEALTARSASEQPQDLATIEPKSADSELPLPTEASERDPKLEAGSTLAPAKEERKDDEATLEPEATGRSDDISSKPEEEAASRAPKGDDSATTELAQPELPAGRSQPEATSAPAEESSQKPNRKRRDASQEDLDEEIANTVEPVSHLAAAAPLELDASKEEEIDHKGEEQLLTVRSVLIASATEEASSNDDESKSSDKEDEPKATLAPKPEAVNP